MVPQTLQSESCSSVTPASPPTPEISPRNATHSGRSASTRRTSTSTTASPGPTERPGLREALAAVRSGDTLVVAKLDRLARSLPDARDIASNERTDPIPLRSTHSRVVRSPVETAVTIGVKIQTLEGRSPGSRAGSHARRREARPAGRPPDARAIADEPSAYC